MFNKNNKRKPKVDTEDAKVFNFRFVNYKDTIRRHKDKKSLLPLIKESNEKKTNSEK